MKFLTHCEIGFYSYPFIALSQGRGHRAPTAFTTYPKILLLTDRQFAA